MVKQRLSQRFRSRRNVLLRTVIAAAPRKGEELRILDIGGRADYWQRLGLEFLREQNARVVILNRSDEELRIVEEGIGVLAYALGNGCELDYPDDSFDLCHSNSVIEHVGLAADMERFAAETRRVAPSYFVQSPNYWFPVDPHFWLLPGIHWLPRPIRARMLLWFPLGTFGRAADLREAYRLADSSQMVSRSQMRFLFADARMHAERFLLFFVKSITAIRIPPIPHNRP
jgi:hypothetical protein